MNGWGAIWSSAMAAAFDEAHELETGARLARRLALPVTALELSPGSIVVRDTDHEWVAQLGCRQLSDGQWETLLRTIATDPELTAAVITGELPIEVHGKAVELGCCLAPDAADVGADCSCPDWHEPCRHVGALVAVVAELIDLDPWLLTMLRGRSRDQVVEAIRRLRSAQRGVEWTDTGDEPRGADPGVAAAAAFRAQPSPLPPPLAVLRRPAPPVSYRPPPADAGLQVADLQRLAADAARRAFELSSGVDGADALTASVEADIARIASHLEPGAPQWEALAAAGGVPADELRRRTAAWTLGGPDGVEVVAHPSELSPEQLARGGAALPGARATREAITADGRQLRVDSDGRWWSFAHSDELGWVVVGGPASDPTDALDA